MATLLSLAGAVPATRPGEIVLDGQGQGMVFEGIGALSAGASSRLLIDYPEPERSLILNLLFRPNWGASFQHLKVEIGGDVNSTDGTEPSHMRTRDDENFTRGYEWWLMKEARARNPDIPLDCLAWGAPAWIGGGKFFSQDCADYMARFLLGARRVHGLDIDYIGIWNEMPYDPAWIPILRRTLDREDLRHVKIVAADESRSWKILQHMKSDPAVADAVAIVGTHYVGCDNGVRRVEIDRPRAAAECGKPLWANEDGPWRGDWTGAGMLAKTYNHIYIEGRMTRTIIWSLITSYYDNLPLPGSGVMRANTPWCGHFEVQPALWATAHTTQFARPGWRYMDSGCILLPGGGSCVALRSPGESADYSVIIETIDAKGPQSLTFRTKNLPAKPLQIWKTTRESAFIHVRQLDPSEEAFTISLGPSCIYSLTTTTGQRKADVSPPPYRPFPTPFREDFENYPARSMPNHFSDQAGVFEVVQREDGPTRCLRQVIRAKGIEWGFHLNPEPETFLGDLGWENYSVSCEVLIEKAGSASIFGRVGKVPQAKGYQPPFCYWMRVRDDGQWVLYAGLRALDCGFVRFPADQWHRLKLEFHDEVIRAFINGVQVSEVEDDTYRFGMAGVGSGWNHARFDNFAVDVEPRPVNLALRKTVSASSEWQPTLPAWEEPIYSPSHLTDGYPGLTRWSAARGKSAGEWVEIDFGQPTLFDRIILRQFEERIARFRVETWDGSTWKVARQAGPMAITHEERFPGVEASRLRLVFEQMRKDLAPSLYEVEVYGPAN